VVVVVGGESGQERPERVVEAGGERVGAVVARARRALQALYWRAPDPAHVDHGKLPGTHPVQPLREFINKLLSF